jgi:hypothetical protein
MPLKQKRKILELIYRSLDGALTEKEQITLDYALKKNESLRKEKQEIEAQREAISSSFGDELHFKPFFAERVMSRIESVPERENYVDIFFNSLFSLFNKLAVIGTVICIIMISYNLSKGESIKEDDAMVVSQVTYEEILDMSLF